MGKNALKNYSAKLFRGVLAGALIGLAACVNALVKQTVKGDLGTIVGSLLFSVDLIAVVLLQANLYTGKIGYVDDKEKAINAALALVSNLIGAVAVGSLMLWGNGGIDMVSPKLSEPAHAWFLNGLGCGALIYIAVECYSKSKSILTLILPVMAFILAGFSHCVADAAYWAMSGFPTEGWLYILMVILGNSLGSLAVRWLQIALKGD